MIELGAWSSSGDAKNMWDITTSCIKKATTEVLGVSRVYWWSLRRLVEE